MEKDIIEDQRNNLKKFMQLHKLKMSSWTKKAGIAEATLRHYLSGRNKSMTSVNLEKLAQAAGVNSIELIKASTIDKNFMQIDKELFSHTFVDVENFINKSNLQLEAKMRANILLAWYELAQILQKNHQSPASLDSLKELIIRMLAKN